MRSFLSPLLAGLVLLVAAGMILPGLSALEPHPYPPDTIGAVDQSMRMIAGRTPFPRQFTKGGNLHLYLLAGVFLPRYLSLPRTRPPAEAGTVFSTDPRWPAVRRHLSDFFLLARMLSALLALLTVLVVFKLGRRLGGARVGGLAGLGLAVSMGFAHTAHLGTEDILGVFLLMICWYYLVDHLAGGGRWSFRAACVAAGLAVSAKASHGLVLIPLILVGLFPPSRREAEPASPRRLVEGVSLVGIAYLITTPSLVVYPLQYVRDVGMEFTRRWSYRGFSLREPGWWYLTAQLANAVGLPLFLALLAGIPASCRRWLAGRLDPAEGLMLLYAGLYLGVVGSWNIGTVFYVVPLMPLLVLPAAHRWNEWMDLPGWRTIAAGGLLFVLVFSAYYTAASIHGFSNDSRRRATVWLEANLPAGAGIDVYSQSVYLPEFPDRVTVRRHVTRAGPNDEWIRGLRRLGSKEPDYLVLSSSHYVRYFRDPLAYPGITKTYRDLLRGNTSYRILKVFGPPVQLDAGSGFLWRNSLTPRALHPIDPTIVVLRRESSLPPNVARKRTRHDPVRGSRGVMMCSSGQDASGKEL